MNTVQWWWDLVGGRAVSDEERGPDMDLLGPYPTKEAAENWRVTHELREEAWKEEDKRWEGEEEEEGDEQSDE